MFFKRFGKSGAIDVVVEANRFAVFEPLYTDQAGAFFEGHTLGEGLFNGFRVRRRRRSQLTHQIERDDFCALHIHRLGPQKTHFVKRFREFTGRATVFEIGTFQPLEKKTEGHRFFMLVVHHSPRPKTLEINHFGIVERRHLLVLTIFIGYRLGGHVAEGGFR